MRMRWWIHISLSRMADDSTRKNELKKKPLRLIERAGGGLLLLRVAGWILCGEPLFLLLLLSLNVR